MIGCFVTGTDTAVGKTLASAALLHALRRHHRRVVGMKPIAAGAVRVGAEWASEDAMSLRAASNVVVPPELDNPVLLREPMSPHLAAARAGVRIDIAQIVHRYRQLTRLADAVVVEGSGGFHVPLSETQTGADLAQALALPVILVVGLRLGCLNHALLTAEAIRARGLLLDGWIANRIDPAMAAASENIDFLGNRLQAPLLADIAHGNTDARSIPLELPAGWWH
ncbi:MAG TPA: dethiobiotin synthase [Ramlibacter sp.]|nr:dethiobiotin synthase [Ramlibacter sp.]